ncbi:hypothetical protein [Agromyces aerolatus]|uniref:hypothetical protein n=1 Tax=Agromyces sp. LY-1074 TaxID=3074080 RepID=UPI002861B0CA|nr:MULTISPECIES: hypothetical protein [unclassified Agromyces]MDR5699192.1 hypothetical protein [Agromyces sp. LY-1074]MDR5705487.1 hypothetical protein [Agromyces sp. LY-1358]
MAFRSLHTLETWLEEFGTLGYPIGAEIKVMQQDGASGANTGLVGVTLTSASTDTYIQPEAVGSSRWVVTFEPRDSAVVLDPAGLLHLSSELATISALCAFLQAKSAEFAGEDLV